MKRAFDIFASGIALLLLSPLLLPLAVILRLTGEGEIFYRQERVGRGGKPFHIYKFATMLKDSPDLAGGDITIASDPRILPMGRFLRNTKINEVPQLLNILLGDMSVVGWRPLTKRVADMFPPGYWEAMKDWRPGLSGVGSIVFRDEEVLLTGVADRQSVYATAIVPYKAELELWYTRNQTFWLDIKLVAATALAVIDSRFEARNMFSDLPQSPAALEALRSRTKDVPAPSR